MNVIPTPLSGVVIIEPDIYHDPRGFFFETYNQRRYEEAGIRHHFVQDNLSFSKKNSLRGLHFQIKHPQAKLVQAVTGEIFDVAVDIRPQSPTFGQWTGAILSEKNRRQFLIPEGFAHGFAVLSDTTLFSYKCSDFYAPHDEGGIRYSDPAINIQWPITDPILSDKDKGYPCLSELSPHQLVDMEKN